MGRRTKNKFEHTDLAPFVASRATASPHFGDIRSTHKS